LFAMAESVDPLRLDFPYRNDGPRMFTEAGSYAAPDAETVHNTTVQFAHSVGEVVTAAVRAGLVIEYVGEHVEVETDVGRGLLPPDVGEELRAELPVDHPMVEGQAQVTHLPDRHGAVVHPRPGRNRTDAKNGCLAGIEDRRTAVDAEDADVGDRDRAVGQV